jgi:hypothetical protein
MLICDYSFDKDDLSFYYLPDLHFFFTSLNALRSFFNRSMLKKIRLRATSRPITDTSVHAILYYIILIIYITNNGTLLFIIVMKENSGNNKGYQNTCFINNG